MRMKVTTTAYSHGHNVSIDITACSRYDYYSSSPQDRVQVYGSQRVHLETHIILPLGVQVYLPHFGKNSGVSVDVGVTMSNDSDSTVAV